jgi:hypothetical protein
MSPETNTETLTLPPLLSIRGIGDLHEQLLERLSKTGSLVVDIPDEAEADLSFIQLMEASCLYARGKGKTILLKKPAGVGIRETLRRGGFLANMDAASREFWLHGKEIQ